ncbi:hypothetical protein R5R35_014559 [Gryllus longicercus]|uniref:PH domain-containing protein n=1 Tax=Gryllus longicercus TaxID=2509291 RepID=A0AAN9Z4Y9_9ORTH
MSSDLSGYLDVKVPAKVRKRGFTPWKAWKKQWCVVLPSENSGVCIQIGSNSSNTIQISSDSTFCHSSSRSRQFAFGVYTNVGQTRRPLIFLAGNSETETQKWMAHIRNLLHPKQPFDIYAQHGEGTFSVSLIDNTLTQSAGLSGFYGVMTVGACHISLSRNGSEEAVASWDWSQFHQFHLAATGKPEDENKICVIHTSSEFPAGPGQMYIFCLQAPQLLDCLLRRGQIKQLLPQPVSLQNSRRLSRSESDLRCYCSVAEATVGSPSKFLRHPALIRSHSGSRDSGVRVSTASDDSGHDIQGKVANSLISAGLGLLFSTPGCSEADNESLHEYQHIGSCESDEDIEQVAALFRTNSVSNTYSPRRESGISLASGIYEEIMDDVFPALTDGQTQNHYENPASLGWRKSLEDNSPPPPLPPRKHKFHTQAKCSMSEEALDEKSKSPPTSRFPSLSALRQGSFPGYSASCSSLASSPLPPIPWSKWSARGPLPPEPEPDYVPMSPRGAPILPPTPPPISHEESHYMVMASLKPS